MIEQADERKSRAQQANGLVLAHGFAHCGQDLLQLQAPRAVGTRRGLRTRNRACQNAGAPSVNMWTSEECGAVSGVRNRNFIGAACVAKKWRCKPGQQRGFVNRQRFGAVKMAARDMSRRAAGMKNARPFAGGNAGDFVFLESARRQRRNLAPIPGGLKRGIAPRAQLPINGHRLPLKRKQRQRQPIKFLLAAPDFPAQDSGS